MITRIMGHWPLHIVVLLLFSPVPLWLKASTDPRISQFRGFSDMAREKGEGGCTGYFGWGVQVIFLLAAWYDDPFED